MLRVENVATPLTAATAVVPPSVAAPGLGPIATGVGEGGGVTVVPAASWTVTVIAGLIATPMVVLLGWTVNASLLAAPTVTLKAVLLAPVSPVAAAVSV